MRLKTFHEREYCGEREKSFHEQLPGCLKLALIVADRDPPVVIPKREIHPCEQGV
ncbi:hypothetical protein [Paraburkholderia monticola]|uniref:hypothetical protein n=1 Tax=Paraburkholderia monticola TaxID=1399968 RepID=UPI000A9A56F5|nr:hypothetical protein [Paraburkholderia monticola]